jgi:hypothetical protein
VVISFVVWWKRGMRGPTGWAEKKMSLWERMAPHTMAASWSHVSMLLRRVYLGRAYNPYACLRDGCCACAFISNLLKPYDCPTEDGTYQSTGCSTAAAPPSDWHLLFVQEAALLRSGRAPRRHSVECPSQRPCWRADEL